MMDITTFSTRKELTPSISNGHPTVLSNGSGFVSLRTSEPGLVKVTLSFDNPAIFAPNPIIPEITFQLLKSGTSRLSTFELVSRLDETGVMFSSFATPDYGVMEFVVLEDQLGIVIPLVFEMLAEPSFPEDEFRRVKALAIQNWKVSRQKTHAIASENFMQAIFSNHPYGAGITEEDLEALSLDDIRSFHQHHVLGSLLTFYVAGFNPDKIAGTIESTLGMLPLPSTTQRKAPVIERLSGPSGSVPSHTPMEGSTQSSIRTGRILFPRSHAQYAAAKVAATILGGYFSSRLMANLREDKGYTYGVGAGVVSMVLGGYLTISADVGKAYRQDALQEIFKEVARMGQEKVDEEELQTVKQYISGSLLRETDGIFNQLNLLANLRRQGLNAGWLSGYFNRVANISSDQVLGFMQTWCKENDLITVTCG